MAIKRKDFQKTSSTILEFLLKLPDEETSSRLRDTLLHALHFLQQYYLILQKRDKEQKPLQWTIERGLSPLTPFREAPDKFQWPWIDVESNKVKQIIPKHSLNNFVNLSPIIVAVREGDLRYVKELLNSEPELIDCVDSFGRDLLTYAVQYQQINILNYLLDEYKLSININIQANDGSTCLHRACYTDNEQHSNIEIIKILLENNADITKQDVHLRSPLHWAVLGENIDCLKLLIEYNANIHIKDIDGMTPAMWACHLDRYEHFKELSRHMNDIIEKDNDGRTWIHHSVRKTEPLECLKYLLSSESILLRDNDGRTCLHVAAEQGSVHACRLIFQMSEQTNNQSYIHDGDKCRQTPLHLATKHGHARVLKELLDHGADPHLKDIHGISALDYAQNRGLYFCRSVFEVYLRENSNNNNNNNINSRSSTTFSFNNNSKIKMNSYDVTPTPPINGHATYIRRNGYRPLNKSLPIGNDLLPSVSIEQYSRTKNYPNSSSIRSDNEKGSNQPPSSSSTNISINGPPIKPRKSSTISHTKNNNLSKFQQNHNHIIINSTHSEDDDNDNQSDANSLAGHGSDGDFDDDDQLLEYDRSNSRLLLRYNDKRFQQQTNSKKLNKNLIYDDYHFLDEQQQQQQLTSKNKSKQQIRTIINKDLSQSTSNRLKSGSKSSSTESIPALDLTVAGQKLFRTKQQQPEIYFTNYLPTSNVTRPPSGRLKPINSAKSTTSSSYTDELSLISNKTLEDVTNNVKQLSSTKTHLYKKKLIPLVNANDAIVKKYSYRLPTDQQQHIVEDISSDRSEETSATGSINGARRDIKPSNLIMNGTMHSHDPSTGYYTGNNPMQTSSNEQYPSTFTPNVHLHQLFLSTKHNNVNSGHTFKPVPIKLNNFNQHNNIQQQASNNLNVYNFENGELSPTAYYDRIHAQVRSNIPIYQHLNSTSTTNSTSHYQFNNSLSPNPSRQPTPAIPNDQTDSTFLVISAAKTNGQSTVFQPSISTPATFSPIPSIDCSTSNQITSDDDPSLDNLYYSMDSLIQRLVPTDTYIPKQSFIYPMLLCSRMNIRPSLLFNQLARLTIKSIANLTFDQSVRTMNNFLYVLSQWTRTFPYDFRNNEMMSQLEDLFKKITSFEPSLQSDVHHIYKKLRSKLKALDSYEEYIRQLNKKTMSNLNQSALVTDIMKECSTSILFAQQLTHIELDRLKPVGAEELIQYFIMKLASEEARAHPNKNYSIESSTSNIEYSNNQKQTLVHDKKLTFCLESYIQWFNRLTFFITTEIIKHTQRRSRIRLINYFIDAAYECFRIQNFNSMIGILGGLNMQPIRRLKRTWEKIQLEKFQQLEQYMNVSKNFATYRLILKVAMEEAEKHGWKTDKIVIPFTSIILQDVYYIKTHSKDYTTVGGINLKKYYSMAKFISEEFVKCKQSKCSFERNDVIINYIITSPTFNEDSLMLASFECEPPATANEKEKYRALQRSLNTS